MGKNKEICLVEQDKLAWGYVCYEFPNVLADICYASVPDDHNRDAYYKYWVSGDKEGKQWIAAFETKYVKTQILGKYPNKVSAQHACELHYKEIKQNIVSELKAHSDMIHLKETLTRMIEKVTEFHLDKMLEGDGALYLQPGYTNLYGVCQSSVIITISKLIYKEMPNNHELEAIQYKIEYKSESMNIVLPWTKIINVVGRNK